MADQYPQNKQLPKLNFPQPDSNKVKAGVMRLLAQRQGWTFNPPPEFKVFHSMQQPRAEPPAGPEAPPSMQPRSLNSRGDELPYGAVSWDDNDNPYYGPGIKGWFNKLKSKLSAPMINEVTGLGLPTPSMAPPWTWDVAKAMYGEDYETPEFYSASDFFKAIRKGEAGTVLGYGSRGLSSLIEAGVDIWQQFAMEAARVYSGAAEVAGVLFDDRDNYPEWMDHVYNKPEEDLSFSEALTYASKPFNEMVAKVGPAWHRGYNAGRVLYSTLLDPMIREQYIERLEGGANPDLLAIELENPLAEAIGQSILDPLNWVGPGVLKPFFWWRKYDKMADIFINPGKKINAAIDALDAVGDARTVNSAENLVKVIGEEFLATAKGMDDLANERNLTTLIASGKRWAIGLEAGQQGAWIVNNMGTTDPDEILDVLAALSDMASGDPDRIATALSVINKAPAPGPLLAPAGRRLGVILNKFIDDPDFISDIEKAKELGGVEDVIKVVDRRMTEAIDQMFPTIDDLVARRDEAIKAVNKLTEKGAQVPADLLDVANMKIPTFALRANKFFKVTQKVVGPINRVLAGVYMGLTPGYAVRNVVQDATTTLIDYGVKAFYHRPTWWNEWLVDMLGHTPGSVGGFGTAAKSFEAAPEITHGGRMLEAIKHYNWRQAADIGEEGSSMRVVGVAVKDALDKLWQPGKAIPDLAPLRKAMPDLPAGTEDWVVQLMWKHKGNVKKVKTEIAKSVSKGQLDVWRAGGWIKRREWGTARRFEVDDAIRNVLQDTSLSEEDAIKAIDGIFLELKKTATRVNDEAALIPVESDIARTILDITPEEFIGRTDPELSAIYDNVADYINANENANYAYAQVVDELLRLSGNNPEIREGMIEALRYSRRVADEVRVRRDAAVMFKKRSADPNFDIAKAWRDLGQGTEPPKTAVEFRQWLWDQYYFPYARTSWNNYRDQLGTAVHGAARLLGQEGSPMLLRARLKHLEAIEWDRYLRDDEIFLRMRRAKMRGNQAEVNRVVALQFGIATHAPKGGATLDRQLLKIINGYLPEGMTPFDSLDDIDEIITREALARRYAARAKTKLLREMEKQGVPISAAEEAVETATEAAPRAATEAGAAAASADKDAQVLTETADVLRSKDLAGEIDSAEYDRILKQYATEQERSELQALMDNWVAKVKTSKGTPRDKGIITSARKKLAKRIDEVALRIKQTAVQAAPEAVQAAPQAAKVAQAIPRMTANEVLERVKNSPQFVGVDKDWARYAEQWGITGDYVLVDVPTAQVSHFYLSQVDEATIAAKAGDTTPIVVSQFEPGRFAVIDGTHTFYAQQRAGAQTVKAFVPETSYLARFAKKVEPAEVIGNWAYFRAANGDLYRVAKDSMGPIDTVTGMPGGVRFEATAASADEHLKIQRELFAKLQATEATADIVPPEEYWDAMDTLFIGPPTEDRRMLLKAIQEADLPVILDYNDLPPVAAGKVRVYHGTYKDHIGKIAKTGLRRGKDAGTSQSDYLLATTLPQGVGGNRYHGELIVVADIDPGVILDPKIDGFYPETVNLVKAVPPENIIAVYVKPTKIKERAGAAMSDLHKKLLPFDEWQEWRKKNLEAIRVRAGIGEVAAPKPRPDRPEVIGATPSASRVTKEQLAGLEKMFEKIKKGLHENWGKTEQVIDNPAFEKALADWEKEATQRVAESKLMAEAVGNAARKFTLHSYREKTNLDMAMAYVLPYHFWYSRTYMRWMERFLMDPQWIAGYGRYQETLEKIHGDAPEWWKYNVNLSELLGVNVDNPAFVNIQALINPMYGLTGVDFNDPKRRVGWFTEYMDDLNKFGPSIWTPISLATAVVLKQQGEQEAAERWGGRLIPQTASFKSLLSMLNINVPVDQGINEIDPAVLYFSNGMDPYERRRVMRQIAVMGHNGEVDPADAMDANYTHSGDIWRTATERAIRERAPGQLMGYFFGAGLKMRTAGDMEIDRFYNDYYKLWNLYDTMSADEWRRAQDALREKYDFGEMLLLGSRNGFERDSSYAYNVLARISPGQKNDIAELVGIKPEMFDMFYENKGNIEVWPEADRRKFMTGIIEIGAVLDLPDSATRQEWTEASLAYNHLYDGVSDDLKMLEDAYRSFGEDWEAKREFLNKYPELDRFMEHKQALIVNHPILSKYYAGFNTVESYYRAFMFDAIEGELGKTMPEILEIQNSFYQQPTPERQKAFKKEHPELEKYWEIKKRYEKLIADLIVKTGKNLKQGLPSTLRKTAKPLSIGEKEIVEYMGTQVSPKYLDYTIDDWMGMFGEEMQRLLMDHIYNGEELPKLVENQVEYQAGQLDIDPYVMLELMKDAAYR